MLATITFFANGVKLYSDTSQQMGTLEQQINSISSTNNYYQTYRAALSEAIEKSQANSVALQKKINNLNSQISQKDSATEPSVIQPVINLVTQEFEEEDD